MSSGGIALYLSKLYIKTDQKCHWPHTGELMPIFTQKIWLLGHLTENQGAQRKQKYMLDHFLFP
jgi:hypothetical protein